MSSYRLSAAGFTLVETLIVISIFAIGMAIALPGFMAMSKANAVKSDARKIKDTLETGRVEAIRRNTEVVVEFRQPTNDSIIFVDTNGNSTFDAGTDTQIRQTVLTGSEYDTDKNGGDGIAIASGNILVWDNRGMSSAVGGALSLGSIYIEKGNENPYGIIINQTGNIRIEKQ